MRAAEDGVPAWAAGAAAAAGIEVGMPLPGFLGDATVSADAVEAPAADAMAVDAMAASAPSLGVGAPIDAGKSEGNDVPTCAEAEDVAANTAAFVEAAEDAAAATFEERSGADVVFEVIDDAPGPAVPGNVSAPGAASATICGSTAAFATGCEPRSVGAYGATTTFGRGGTTALKTAFAPCPLPFEIFGPGLVRFDPVDETGLAVDGGAPPFELTGTVTTGGALSDCSASVV